MAFDVSKFENTAFKHRTQKVPVPELRAFFDEGEDPVFEVRAIDGYEWANSEAAAKSTKNLVALMQKLASPSESEKADAILESLGIPGANTPAETARRIYLLQTACVQPALSGPAVVRICTYFPVQFLFLTNVILTLSGEGSEAEGEPLSFTPSPASS